jgi:hypothetical protein
MFRSCLDVVGRVFRTEEQYERGIVGFFGEAVGSRSGVFFLGMGGDGKSV